MTDKRNDYEETLITLTCNKTKSLLHKKMALSFPIACMIYLPLFIRSANKETGKTICLGKGVSIFKLGKTQTILLTCL